MNNAVSVKLTLTILPLVITWAHAFQNGNKVSNYIYSQIFTNIRLGMCKHYHLESIFLAKDRMFHQRFLQQSMQVARQLQSPEQADTKIPKTCSSIYFDLYDLQL